LSGELYNHLRHAAEEDNGAMGCPCSPGHQSRWDPSNGGQKRKATCPTPQDKELDQEISNLEAIHQQVEKRREKMLRLAELQKKIDEAAEEMRHIA
jgi:hypothetical protein